MPLDVSYRTTNAYGWPRPGVAVSAADSLGRPVIVGYGSVLVPLSGSGHTRRRRPLAPGGGPWPEGARAAANYKATQHCIQFFGTSEIDWTLAPDADAQTLRVVDDTLTFSGSCHDPAA